MFNKNNHNKKNFNVYQMKDVYHVAHDYAASYVGYYVVYYIINDTATSAIIIIITNLIVSGSLNLIY